MNMSGTRSDPPDISIRDGRSRVWTDFTLHDLKSESPEHSTPPSGQKNGFNFSKRPGLNIRCSTLPKDRLTDRSCFRPGRLPMPRPTMNDRLERELEYGGLRIKRRPRNISEATMFSSAVREMKKPSLMPSRESGRSPSCSL